MTPRQPLDKLRKRGKLLLAAASACFLAAGLVSTQAQPAEAWTSLGCQWNTKSLNFNVNATSGNARSAINTASYEWNNRTGMAIVNMVNYSAWAAENANYGNNGYEGYTNWNCSRQGYFNDVQTRLNNYYLSGAPTMQLKVVWLHEIGHSLGLNHVTTSQQIMYKSASLVYNKGIYYLSRDEELAIQSLY